MKVRRFKVEMEMVQGRQAMILDRREIRHIEVLRLKEGDPVIQFDGKGKEYPAVITSLSPAKASFTLVQGPPPVTMESPLKIVLGVALLKSDRFEWLLQKATELGVSEIVPFQSLRVVPRWEEDRLPSRHSRWEKIVSEAAKQCGRASVPVVHPPRSFVESLAVDFDGAIKIFLWEKEKEGTLKEALRLPSPVIYALIGPEGGFSEEEAGQARQAGFQPIRLGPRILRAETAGVAIACLLQFARGDLS